MRRVSIVVMCDACEEGISEDVEGASLMTYTARGVTREMDICDDCLHGTFLQEGRPVANRKKREKKETKEFSCDECDKAFGTQRGLNHHRTKMHGGSQ